LLAAWLGSIKIRINKVSVMGSGHPYFVKHEPNALKIAPGVQVQTMTAVFPPWIVEKFNTAAYF